jgi:cytochrome c-type biogenesis protein CcmH/NrfG
MTGSGKRVSLLFLTMALVAVAGWYGRKAYKQITERKLLARAADYLEKRDIKNASLCLQRALQLDPTNPKASQLTADVLEAVGSSEALTWRIRTFELQTNNIEFRLAWAQTALMRQNPASASLALSDIDPSAVRSAAYHKLKGALDWESGKRDSAEAEYLEALRLEPTNQTISLNLATVRLFSTNDAVATGARLALEQTPTNSPLRITALRYLITDARAHKNSDHALALSKELVQCPQAAFADKIGRLQLLRDINHAEFDTWLIALKEEARNSGEGALRLVTGCSMPRARPTPSPGSGAYLHPSKPTHPPC